MPLLLCMAPGRAGGPRGAPPPPPPPPPPHHHPTPRPPTSSGSCPWPSWAMKRFSAATSTQKLGDWC